MEEPKKDQSQAGGGSPAQNPPEKTPQGIPQGRFDEVYRNWKEEQERNAGLVQHAQVVEQENLNLRTSMDNYMSKPSAGSPVIEAEVPKEQKKEMTDEEWNEWYQDNPRKALAWEREKRFAKERQDRNKEQANTDFLSQQIRSRENVVTKHPDMYLKTPDGKIMRTPEGVPVFDEKSEKWKFFKTAADASPELIGVRKGPEMAMREMERLMKEQGKNPDKEYNEGVQEGVQKQQAAAANAHAGYTAPATGTPPPSNKPTEKISEEENRVANGLGVSAEDYAKNKGVPRNAPRKKVDYS